MRIPLLAALCLLSLPLLPAQTPPPMHIALMFDDGPTSTQLEKFIELFKREQIHVTFSFIANNVTARPQLAKAALAAGHEITNHSFDHKHPAGLSEKELDHEVIASFQVLETQVGYRPVWYWPPFVEITPELEKTVAKTSMRIFRPTHLVSSDDWNTSVSAENIRKNALNGVDDGTTILFHEWRQETFEQMPAILAELKKRGAVFLTISELTSHLNKNNAPSKAQPGPK